MHTSSNQPLQPGEPSRVPVRLGAVGGSVLEKNLALLTQQTADRVRSAPPRGDLEWTLADDGLWTGTIGSGKARRQLASLRRPGEEGDRWARSIDLKAAGAVVVNGFGAGYHVAALARAMRRTGVILVFEPDAALLRAVLERIDCTEWLGRSNVAVLTDADDVSAIAAACVGMETVLTMGARLADHPASRARLGESALRFGRSFATHMKAVRLQMVTTLVQVETTLRNLLMNLDHYAACPGVAELAGAASGRPAVVVSAGPSLERNLHLLKDPANRERVVVVAVQTVLKKMLAAGVKPDFVCALDYHEISRRFYEGLTPADVEGVTLIAEPKANPAILESFPGAIRCPRDAMLDRLLGPDMARDRGELVSGATVAHLAYGVARHLGCDPVILIGQDLGFTDGQYYSARAAIHEVWGSELNPFNSLETMEWQRIARFGPMLQRTTDVLGRPVYTDDQMHAYLLAFEQLFRADAARGLRTIDATEGGVLKKHTEVMTLAHALEQAWEVVSLPDPGPPRRADAPLRARLAQRLRSVRGDAAKVESHSRRTAQQLRMMLEHQGDQARVNRLIGEVERTRDRVEALEPAYGLIHFLNQTGAFKRFKADRAIDLEPGLSPMERQRRQIERDVMNVSWLADAAEHTGRMLDDAVRAMEGAPRITRDPPPPTLPSEEGESARQGPRRVAAVIVFDRLRDALGLPRGPEAGEALRATLERLSRCRAIDGVVLLTDEPEHAAAIAGAAAPRRTALHIERTDLDPWRRRQDAIRGGRLWARRCWRGGLAGLTVFDEACSPSLVAPALERLGYHAAACVGPDWTHLDPALTDRVIERYRERPDGPMPGFSQAPPGLAPCCVGLDVLKDLAAGSRTPGVGVFSTIGGMLGYIPIMPRFDPIGKAQCVSVPPAVRDARARLIADRAASGHPGAVELLRVELTTRRSRRRGPDLPPGQHPQADLPIDALRDAVARLGDGGRALAVSFEGRGDALLHPRWRDALHAAREAGAAGIHVRTDLCADPALIDELARSGVEVVSVDVLADSAAGYEALTGEPAFPRVVDNIERLAERRPAEADGLPTLWVVPRLTRCDGAYGELESFYIRWLMRLGCAAIDPLPAQPPPGQRITPLPRPAWVDEADAASTATLRADGTLELPQRRPHPASLVEDKAALPGPAARLAG